jgi:choline-sulfatase
LAPVSTTAPTTARNVGEEKTMVNPNIVLVVSDQHRGDWVGYGGNGAVRTPNLDRLAADGVAFTQAYCNSPLCVPSRMSMLTGRYPHHIGVHGNEDCLPSGIPTVAHAMALGGYDTVLCGRMHFVGPDQRHGFQTRLVGDITPSYPGGPRTNYAHLTGTPGPIALSVELAGPGESPVLDYDEAVVTACEEFVSERASLGDGKPVFLTVGLYGPHPPFTCSPEQYVSALEALREHDSLIPMDRIPHPYVEQLRRDGRLDTITPEQITMARANYVGLIGQLDHHIGRITEAAKALPGDTLLIYVSDHGEMAGDHGLFWKRSCYEGSARVPMVWYPVKQQSRHYVDRGRRVDVPVSLVDLAPSLTGITGSPRLPHVDGDDLTTLLGDGGDDALDWADRPVYSELILGDRWAVRMVRHDRHKLVYYHGRDPQLFDLAEDPAEVDDLAGDMQYAGVCEELTARILADWEPEMLLAARSARRAAPAFMREWGRKVGAGRMDLWTETGRFYRELADGAGRQMSEEQAALSRWL